MNKYYFILISFFSLAIRAIYSYYSWYIRDQARVFDLGFQIYKYHILPIQGSPVVYTNSLLPGSLQAILASIPLFLSGGHPYSIILFVQLLNFIACLIIYKISVDLFGNSGRVSEDQIRGAKSAVYTNAVGGTQAMSNEEVGLQKHALNKYFLFAFIILNPMNIIFSYGWNPAFIIIFSALFFLGLVKVCKNKKDKLGLFLVLFPHLFIMQLNLQFLILAVLVLVLIIRKIVPWPSLKILSLSLLPGVLTLLPMIIEKFFRSAPVENNWNMNGSILQNIQFNFENLFSYLHVLARFLSYATGETTRNLGEGFLKTHPQVWPFFLIGMLGTAFIFCVSTLFYLDRSKWKLFFKESTHFTVYEKLDVVLLYLPIVATILFVFSVTPPTTHKIWSLFPFCFYPFFRVLNQGYSEILWLKRRLAVSNFHLLFKNRFKFFSIYIISALIYSTFGGARVPTNFAEIFHDSKNFCKVNSKQELEHYTSQTDYSTKEYTMAIMCEYFNSSRSN